MLILTEIRSGGQTGADQGGLRAGLVLGLKTGGWIPKGRRTEDGRMSDEDFKRFDLQEHSFSAYNVRTEDNILEADGTAIFGDIASSGSKLTIKLCKHYDVPFIVNPTTEELQAWLDKHDIGILNVAGNRERVNPGIGERVFQVIANLKLC